MPKVELRTSSASAAARAESNAAVVETPVDGGAHRAPVATVVGDDPDDLDESVRLEPAVAEGRHAGPTIAQETQDPR